MNKKEPINNQSGSSANRREKAFQADELSYLSSVASEEFAITDKDLSQLMSRIDKAAPRGGGYGGAIFISLLCGVLIGMSVFFVYFNKSKNHPGSFQPFDNKPADAELSLNNAVNETDTTLVMPPADRPKPYHQEHFASTQDIAPAPVAQEIAATEVPEELPSQPVAVDASTMDAQEEDLVLKFVANAPVVFIHNLKVTNYRQYYFNHDKRIGTQENTGLPVLYSDTRDIAAGLPEEKDRGYYAHQEIKDAMLEFSKGQYAACIHHLQDLQRLNEEDVNALFYSGMSYYYMINDARAVDCFNRVINSENNVFHQEAAFYKAQSLLRMKQSDEARVLLKTIEQEKGFYSARAAALLGSMK